jgi:hypothetical protein
MLHLLAACENGVLFAARRPLTEAASAALESYSETAGPDAGTRNNLVSCSRRSQITNRLPTRCLLSAAACLDDHPGPVIDHRPDVLWPPGRCLCGTHYQDRSRASRRCMWAERAGLAAGATIRTSAGGDRRPWGRWVEGDSTGAGSGNGGGWRSLTVPNSETKTMITSQNKISTCPTVQRPMRSGIMAGRCSSLIVDWASITTRLTVCFCNDDSEIVFKSGPVTAKPVLPGQHARFP